MVVDKFNAPNQASAFYKNICMSDETTKDT